MKIEYNQNVEALRKSASQKLQLEIERAKSEGKAVLFLASGGSALGLLQSIPSELWVGVTIMVLDERFSTDPKLNNSLQLEEKGLPVTKTVPEKDETLEEFANRCEQLIIDWKAQHPDGSVIATVGMGDDGHIAGISPFPNEPEKFNQIFEEHLRNVVGYVGNLNPSQRVTVTPRFMKEGIDTAIVYIIGENKQAALDRVFAQTGNLAQTPARVLQSMNGEVYLFTDRVIVN